MERARATAAEARLLFKGSMFPGAVNRIYYSMFYALTALAVAEGFSSGKHGRLLGWFNKQFVKAGIIDIRYSKIIFRAFSKRMDGDYEAYSEFTETEVREMLGELDDFIAEIEKLLKSM
ncbi:MAG TPA: HEPN domain-containing protein [Spirochaetota bacterium]|nr:HEPN domain-containing protein [Spirochaetota bacterium]